MPAASAMLAISRARTMPPDFTILMLTRSAISPRTISIASAGLNTLSSAMIGVSMARVIAAIARALVPLDGLLDEGWPERFHVPDLADRIPGIEPLVVVDPQLDGRGQARPADARVASDPPCAKKSRS